MKSIVKEMIKPDICENVRISKGIGKLKTLLKIKPTRISANI